MKLRAAFAVAAGIALAGCDKTPDPICQELDATIDSSIRRVALTLAEGEVFDKGAMQQAARYAAANNHLEVIRISLDLQTQHKCPIRKSVINPLMYDTEALKCLSATVGSEKKDEAANLCDIKKWKGSLK